MSPARQQSPAVTNSGSEVPNATNVAAMMLSGTFTLSATILTAGISTDEAATTNKIPNSNFDDHKHRISKIRRGYALLPSCCRYRHRATNESTATYKGQAG